VPRYERLRQDLEGACASGRWKPGEPIPTEARLAQAHGVSIGTVRKAVDSLVADGWLERIQGKGTFVRRPRLDATLFRFFRLEGRGGSPIAPGSRILACEAGAAP